MQSPPHAQGETLSDTYELERKELSGSITMLQIRAHCLRLKHDETLTDILFRLLDDPDPRTAGNAAWIFTHADDEVYRWLSTRFDELAEKAMRAKHETLRRLLLAILHRLPFPGTPHVGLLDFCLTGMLSCRQPYGIRSLCMKIACKICLPVPELREEFRLQMDIMEPDLLPPSLRSVRKNILKSLKKGKSLRP